MSETAIKSDLELAELVRQGCHLAFGELVTRHTDRFFALAYRTLQNQRDAEDVVQAAFIKFWQRPELWNAEQSKFTTWFYRVIVNACHDLHRKAATQRSFESTLAEGPSLFVASEEVGMAIRQSDEWRKQCVESGIQILPIAQRDALNLVIYCEIAQKDAADILGITLKALESTLFRAKKNLSKYVQDQMKRAENQLKSVECGAKEVRCCEK